MVSVVVKIPAPKLKDPLIAAGVATISGYANVLANGDSQPGKDWSKSAAYWLDDQAVRDFGKHWKEMAAKKQSMIGTFVVNISKVEGKNGQLLVTTCLDNNNAHVVVNGKQAADKEYNASGIRRWGRVFYLSKNSRSSSGWVLTGAVNNLKQKC
jgi:hypothetical protein